MSESLDPAADTARPLLANHPSAAGIAPAATAPAAPPAPAQPAADEPQAASWLRSRLRWFLAEFVVVVAGVLVAMALTGLIEEQRDHQREQVYLRQLSADLGRSETELAEAVEFMQARADAAARVLHKFWRDEPALDQSFFTDLTEPRSTRRFRPVLGTAEALSSSGELGLIRSDSLRAYLLAYVELMKTRLDEINRYDETYYRPGVALLSLGPILRPPANFEQPLADDRNRARPNHYERVPFPSDAEDFWTSRESYTGFNYLLTAHRNHAGQYGEMLQETRALRAKVDADIKR